jgi:hypothetical protein
VGAAKNDVSEQYLDAFAEAAWRAASKSWPPGWMMRTRSDPSYPHLTIRAVELERDPERSLVVRFEEPPRLLRFELDSLALGQSIDEDVEEALELLHTQLIVLAP